MCLIYVSTLPNDIHIHESKIILFYLSIMFLYRFIYCLSFYRDQIYAQLRILKRRGCEKPLTQGVTVSLRKALFVQK